MFLKNNYYFKQPLKLISKTLTVFVVILVMIIPFWIREMALFYEDYMMKHFDLQVSLTAPLNIINNVENINSFEEYKTKIQEYRNLVKTLASLDGVKKTEIKCRTAMGNNGTLMAVSLKDGYSFYCINSSIADFLAIEQVFNPEKDVYQSFVEEFLSSGTVDEGFLYGMEGVSSLDISYFNDKKLTLSSGRLFTSEEMENGDMVCIISRSKRTGDVYDYGMRTHDGISEIIRLGDTVTFTEIIRSDTGVKAGNEYRFKVIGIVDKDFPDVIFGKKMSEDLIVPLNTFDRITSETVLADNGQNNKIPKSEYYISPVVFSFGRITQLVSFLKEMKKVLPADYSYYTSLEDFVPFQALFSSVIENIGLIATVMFACGMLVTAIVSFIETNMRKKEWSLRLALGESRKKIIITAGVENLMVILICVLMCAMIINYGYDKLNSYLETLFNTGCETITVVSWSSLLFPFLCISLMSQMVYCLTVTGAVLNEDLCEILKEER